MQYGDSVIPSLWLTRVSQNDHSYAGCKRKLHFHSNNALAAAAFAALAVFHNVPIGETLYLCIIK